MKVQKEIAEVDSAGLAFDWMVQRGNSQRRHGFWK